jgi:hypothetical protein
MLKYTFERAAKNFLEKGGDPSELQIEDVSASEKIIHSSTPIFKHDLSDGKFTRSINQSELRSFTKEKVKYQEWDLIENSLNSTRFLAKTLASQILTLVKDHNLDVANPTRIYLTAKGEILIFPQHGDSFHGVRLGQGFDAHIKNDLTVNSIEDLENALDFIWPNAIVPSETNAAEFVINSERLISENDFLNGLWATEPLANEV